MKFLVDRFNMFKMDCHVASLLAKTENAKKTSSSRGGRKFDVVIHKPIVFSLLLATMWLGVAYADPVKVVASFSIIGDMVEKVAGDKVELYTIVGADQDTHVYEPKPKDAKAVGDADILIMNGLGFEGWMERLVDASGSKALIVKATDGISALSMEEDGKNIQDPHAWHSPENGIIYVDNIASALIKADPDNGEFYKNNADKLKTEIANLSQWAKAEIAKLSPPLKKVITAHDAFGYMGRAYGIDFMAPMGISTESEPSAKTIAKLLKQIRETGVRALFVENIANPRVIEQIADEAHIKVSGQLYSDALSKKGSEADSYTKMLKHNISTLIKAMQ